ncbi:MAG: hypothetical protein R3E48_23070 [Burkholderiaceae bacterium]
MKVFVDGESQPLWSVAEGNGPVNALDQSCARILAATRSHRLIELVDYKVRILT